MDRRTFIVPLICIAIIASHVVAVRAMTSTNFQIYWDSVNIGGEDTSTSTNYYLRDTIGEIASGTSTSANFKLSAGYRVGDYQEPFITFNIGTQENSTETAYSAFSNAGKSVTVSSASSFSVNDYIGVVENLGLSQLIAVGKITEINGTILTVDSWSGEPASLSASPGGSDDFVYRLGGNAASFGVQSSSAGKTGLTRTNVTTNASSGYTVQVQADGDLRVSTSTIITNVSDGAVSIGSEEYGGEVVGSYAVGTGGDFAFSSTNTRTIQQSSTYGSSDRVGLIYKISIASNTPSGNYQQLITFTATASY